MEYFMYNICLDFQMEHKTDSSLFVYQTGQINKGKAVKSRKHLQSISNIFKSSSLYLAIYEERYCQWMFAIILAYAIKKTQQYCQPQN